VIVALTHTLEKQTNGGKHWEFGAHEHLSVPNSHPVVPVDVVPVVPVDVVPVVPVDVVPVLPVDVVPVVPVVPVDVVPVVPVDVVPVVPVEVVPVVPVVPVDVVPVVPVDVVPVVPVEVVPVDNGLQNSKSSAQAVVRIVENALQVILHFSTPISGNTPESKLLLRSKYSIWDLTPIWIGIDPLNSLL